MKTFASLAVLLALGAATTAPALAADGPMCLRSRDVDTTKALDAHTILFRMKDGKVWRSSMRAACPSLRFNGFEYVTRFDEICGGSQMIRVLETSQVCVLGRFTPEPVAAPHS